MQLKDLDEYKEICRLLKLDIDPDGLPYITPWYKKLWHWIWRGKCLTG